MPLTERHLLSDHQRQSFTRALDAGGVQRVSAMLQSLHPGEIGNLLESLPPNQRQLVWGMLHPEIEGEVLAEVSDEVRASLIDLSTTDELVSAAEGLALDDLADILEDLPDTVALRVLDTLEDNDRLRLETVLTYDEDTAGGLTNPETITVRPDVTLDVVQRYLRRQETLPDHSDAIIVVDRYDHYIGVLRLSDVLIKDPGAMVDEVMLRDVEALPVDMSASDVAKRFEERDLISAPVVDRKNKLLGRITVDDVVDVIREEGENTVLRMAGLDEGDDMFAPVVPSARRRAVWLGINLITALLAAWVIGMFEHALDQVVALAVLMPVVASMGGIAGSQTLTLVIRGMAVGQVGSSNARSLLIKEGAVGVLNGLIWAAVVAVIAILWFGNPMIGAIIAAAILINLVVGAFSGVIIPLVMRRLGVDPALAGGVALTTITDVVGFAAFLGLGALILL